MATDTVVRWLALVMLLTAFVMSGYHRRKADRVAGEPLPPAGCEGVPLVVLRALGLPLLAAFIVYFVRPGWLAWGSLPLPAWARWSGVGLGVGSLLLMLWVFRSLGPNITPTVVTRRMHTLVQHGPYRWVRHPLYSGGTLFLASFSLMAANWVFAAGMSLAFTLVALRTPTEEARLIERFGDDYRDYMRRTGRYLPRFGRARGP